VRKTHNMPFITARVSCDDRPRPGLLARLRPNHPCASDASKHEKHLQEAQRVVARAARCALRYAASSRFKSIGP
jgi:hypothetical protein